MHSAFYVLLSLFALPPELECVLDWMPPEQPPFSATEMEEKCSAALALIPAEEAMTRAQVLLRRGTLRQSLQDKTEARSDIVEARQLDPSDLDIWYADAASAFLVDGNVERIEREASTMIASHPAAPHGYRLAAQVAWKLRNNPAGGVGHLEKVIVLGVANRRDYADLASCYGQQQRWRDALKETDAALLLPPTYPGDDAQIYGTRGIALGTLGHHRAALASLHRASLINPEIRFLRPNLWNCYARLAMYGSCLRVSREQVEQSPQLGRPYSQLGLTSAHFGSKEEAVALCLRAIEIEPKSWFTWHYLGRVQLRAGDHIGAMKSWQKASLISASDPVVAMSEEQELDFKAQRLANDLRIAFLRTVSSVENIRDPKTAAKTCRDMLADTDVGNCEHVRIVLACALAGAEKYEDALVELDKASQVPGLETSLEESVNSLKSLFRERRPYILEPGETAVLYEVPLFYGIRLRRGEIDYLLP